MLAGLGIKPAISEKWEQRLHDHVLKLSGLGFGLDWCDIRALGVKIAEAEGIKHLLLVEAGLTVSRSVSFI